MYRRVHLQLLLLLLLLMMVSGYGLLAVNMNAAASSVDGGTATNVNAGSQTCCLCTIAHSSLLLLPPEVRELDAAEGFQLLCCCHFWVTPCY